MFSGPSKDVVLQMARGVAAVAAQIRMLDSLNAGERATIEAKMRSEGAPTSIQELSRMAASVVHQHRLGFLRKNQYLGAIEAHLALMGFSRSDARFIKGQIELLAS
jgi:hypothetical protein